MAAQKWLNWSPRSKEVLASSQEGTDKTDNPPRLSVLSAQSEQKTRTSEPPRPTPRAVDAHDDTCVRSASAPLAHDAPTTVTSDLQNHAEKAGPPSMPWAEWKARQLNGVFEEQGATRKPSRITAETVRRGGSHETARGPKEGPGSRSERVSAQEVAQALSVDDYRGSEARGEIAGLLAIGYRRHAAIRRVGAEPRKDLGNTELANSGGPSVHGVVP